MPSRLAADRLDECIHDAHAPRGAARTSSVCQCGTIPRFWRAANRRCRMFFGDLIRLAPRCMCTWRTGLAQHEDAQHPQQRETPEQTPDPYGFDKVLCRIRVKVPATSRPYERSSSDRGGELPRSPSLLQQVGSCRQLHDPSMGRNCPHPGRADGRSVDKGRGVHGWGGAHAYADTGVRRFTVQSSRMGGDRTPRESTPADGPSGRRRD